MPNISIDLTNLPYITNPKFYPYYTNKSRYLVLWGGAGSGKSVFSAQKLVTRCLSENPQPADRPKHKFLVVRKVAKTLRHSAYAEIRNVIAQWGMTKLFTFRESDLEIRCLTGNSIIFAGLDDVEKLKSIANVTGIWIEEASELTQEDFQQLDIRLRGQPVHYHQIILSFNPVSITHWLKEVFFDAPSEDRQCDIAVVHSTYRDNQFIDAEYSRVLESMKDQDPYYYTVYALGEWGVTGQTVYSAEIVTARLLELKEQYGDAKKKGRQQGREQEQYQKQETGQEEGLPLRGVFAYDFQQDNPEQINDSSIRFIPDPQGPLTIYEAPIPGYPYVIGGDTAEGGHDYSVGQVRNNITWNQAATWRDRTDTDLYAKQMYCLGRFYNTALIGIETNFDLHPVKELERLRYPKQYIRQTVDSYTNRVQQRYGFRTDKATRPVAIANHVTLARESIETFNDITTLEEMLTFVRNDQGRPEAQEGQHDDTIMADAICLAIRDQQTMALERKPEPKQQLPWQLRDDDGRGRVGGRVGGRTKKRGYMEW